MTISPLSPVLWISGMLVLFITLLLYAFGKPLADPIISVIFFLFTQEMSKLIAELTMEDDDG